MQKQNQTINQTPVTIWFPKQDAILVRTLAAQQNLSRSEFIRRVISQKLEEGGKNEPQPA